MQGHEHLCHTGISVRNGNLGTDRTTTTKAANVRKQLGANNSKTIDGRQAKNVKGRDGSAEALDRETGEEQITVTGHVERMADDRLPKRAAALREHIVASVQQGCNCIFQLVQEKQKKILICCCVLTI